MVQAPRQANRGLYDGVAKDGDWTGRINLAEWDSELMLRPIRQARPRRIFVNSMSDLFHENVPVDHIATVFAVMALAPQHQFQILTKRSKRMALILNDPDFPARVQAQIAKLVVMSSVSKLPHIWEWASVARRIPWPMTNVWLGVSVESQRYTFRLDHLLEIDWPVRWVSAEPLVAALDLGGYLGPERINWLVVGGESGQHARPMHPAWPAALLLQAEAAGVPFLFKQWGNWAPYDPKVHGTDHRTMEVLPYPGTEHGAVMVRLPKHDAGRTLYGIHHDGYPPS